MNTVSPEKKEAMLKSLAIVGFIGVIGFIAWAAVQIVSLAPSAFSSLASIAEGLNQYQQSLTDDEQEPLVITSDSRLLNTGSPVTITWEQVATDGSYSFSYQCVEGVAVDVSDSGNARSIACDTPYDLGNESSVTVVIDSEKERFVDVPYTISFFRENSAEAARTGSTLVTVINQSIADGTANPDGILGEVTDEEAPTTATTSATSTPSRPTKPTPEYTYTIPVSNPNGTTDLATRFLNIGVIKNGVFSSQLIKQNSTGAIQFEIKNLGTKTSAGWTYTVALPDGDTYKSDVQAPLKPSERAIITIGFPTTTEKSHTFVVKVDEKTDKVTLNDTFKQMITFVK